MLSALVVFKNDFLVIIELLAFIRYNKHIADLQI